MHIKLGAALASGLTISIGWLTTFGLLVSRDDLGLPPNLAQILRNFTNITLQIVTVAIALTLFIGIFNLVYVHGRRLIQRERGALYSLPLLLSFALVIVTYLIDRDTSLILLRSVQAPLESAFAGLLLFALVFGAARMLRGRVSGWGLLFVGSLLLALIGAIPLAALAPFHDLRSWFLDVPVNAGARGLLLGLALATIVTGMRVLIGVDRSYRD